MAALELFILDSSFSALSYTPVGIASDASGVIGKRSFRVKEGVEEGDEGTASPLL